MSDGRVPAAAAAAASERTFTPSLRTSVCPLVLGQGLELSVGTDICSRQRTRYAVTTALWLGLRLLGLRFAYCLGYTCGLPKTGLL